MKTAPIHTANSFNLFAHRGINLYKVPENTLPALERALEAGFSIEFDVQKVKGGYILYHDDFIPGPNDKDLNGGGFYLQEGKKPITECTLRDVLLKAEFDKAKHENILSKQAGETVQVELTETPHIATFGDFLSLFKRFPHSMAQLEIKRPNTQYIYNDGMEEEIIGMLSDNNLLNNIIINSSNVSTLKNIRKADSNVSIAIDTDFTTKPKLAHDLNEAIKMKEEIGIKFWNPPFKEITAKLLEDITSLNLILFPWVWDETKQEELNEIKRLKSIGVKYLFTNQVEEALKIYQG